MKTPPPSFLRRIFPVAGWLPSYDRGHLKQDLNAGVTVAIMLVPQAMAYAMLAGLPPIVGLYASIVPVLLYALFGTSRQLAVGPVAMVSLLTASGVGAMAAQGTPEYLGYAILLSLLVGVMQLAMGLFRLGAAVNFLSHPVVSGFTSAAALIIGSSQLKHLLGFSIPRSHHVHTIWLTAARDIAQTNLPTLAIGLLSIITLYSFKKLKPRFPAPLVVVGLATLAVWGLGLPAHGVAIVSDVPNQLPTPMIPTLDLEAMRALLPIAATISLVGFMESISVAKVFASKHGYRLDANQELIGLGVANLGGAFTGAYPVTGGFSRSAVNDQAGAKTPLASIITALFIALSVRFATPLFYFLPKAVLAAIIMVAVVGLIDLKEVKHLWQVKRSDLALLVLTFFSTLALGIEAGIGIGVAASLVWFFLRRTRPNISHLGRMPNGTAWLAIKENDEARQVPGVLVVRFDAALFYGNVSWLKEQLDVLEQEAEGTLGAVIIDASAINELDSSGAHALEELHRDYQKRGIRLMLASLNKAVRTVLERAHLTDEFGPDNLVWDVNDAITRIEGAAPEAQEAA